MEIFSKSELPDHASDFHRENESVFANSENSSKWRQIYLSIDEKKDVQANQHLKQKRVKIDEKRDMIVDWQLKHSRVNIDENRVKIEDWLASFKGKTTDPKQTLKEER